MYYLLYHILPLVVVFSGCCIAFLTFAKILIGFSRTKEKVSNEKIETLEEKTKMKYALPDYISEIKKINLRANYDMDVYECVDSILKNLERLEKISADDDEMLRRNIDRFTQRYLPLISDNIKQFSQIPVSKRTAYKNAKENMLDTLRLFDDLLCKTIEEYEDQNAHDVEIDSQALQGLINMNENLREKGDFYH